MTPRRWLRALTALAWVALALAALAGALALLSAARALSLAGWSAGALWTALLPDENDAWFLIVFTGGFQMAVQYYRARAAWRVAALAGDAEAAPLASAKLIPGAEPATGDGADRLVPAALRWELTPHGRRLRIVPWTLYAALLLMGAAGVVWLWSTTFAPWSAPSDLASILFLAFAALLALVGFGVLGLALRARLRGPVGVAADSVGVSAWTQRGPGALLPWSDVRLLEASWFGLARKRVVPYLRAYRADGTSVGWPVFTPPEPDERRIYTALGMSNTEAADASRALVRLAVAQTGLPVRTVERSLSDPKLKPGVDLAAKSPGVGLDLGIALALAALAEGALAYRWPAAEWLSGMAAVGLGLCAARLAYWYVRDALRIRPNWEREDGGERARYPALWPSLLALSGAALVAVVLGALTSGRAHAWDWTTAEVLGGAVCASLGGALTVWARASSQGVTPSDSVRPVAG